MKKWFCVILPVIILGSLIAWRLGQVRSEVAEQSQQRAMRMNAAVVAALAEVRVRDIAQVFEATGSVEAPLDVKLAPKVTGRITYLEVREGDRVRKGQVLVRIDDSEIEANVQQQMANVAEAKYRLAQAELNQTPTDVAVSSQIRQQEAAAKSARADYEQVKQNYEAEVAAASASVTDANAKIEAAKAAVSGAEANLKNAKTKYDRIYGLYKQGYIAAQDVDDAQAAVNVQQSALDAANSALKSATAQKEAAEQRLSITKKKGKADIEAANAKMVQAEASLEHAQANTSQKSAYRQSISALKASVAAAEASLRSAQAKRQDTVLVSPLDGYVTARYADPGAIASPTQPILSLQFIKQVWVTVSVPEEVCSRLHIGQDARIRFDALPGRVFTASVVQINPAADPQSRQYVVRVILSNKDNLLKPGMFAHVSLETDKVRDVVAVPREALQEGEAGPFVIVVDKKNTAKRTPVVTGAEDADYVAVLDGVRAGDRIVIRSAFPIRDGQIVTTGGKGGKQSGGSNGAKKI